jgi:hypothetical protein
MNDAASPKYMAVEPMALERMSLQQDQLISEVE